ncbi:MAG: flagellar biosynthesis protein FlhA [Nitrospiraceae bacterium]|nr:flagellar biosynthesis protein FlhA [Nitrospiraceae bacterium]
MKFLLFIKERTDLVVAVFVLGILGVMMLPVPPFALDLLLSLSISMSIVILVTAIYVKKPLDFSVFPPVLLLITLFRLSLEVASTRLILLRGGQGTDAAGKVIKSFGQFIVGGNSAVGFIIFLILIIINFVVITKGSGRVAEVAARFTLDAMPGKQMAIDADLNAGLIDEDEARRRRSLISREADFYGAMDGSSKFVRGDAIAALIITAINIIGGLAIGILQKGMPIAQAAQTYTILTIGDGLVSQMPALLVSTAAGIVVTRAGQERDLSKEITAQLVLNPKALGSAAGIMVVLGLIPGLPHVPFFLLSASSGAIAYAINKSAPVEEAEKPDKAKTQKEDSPLEKFLEIEPLTFEIGYGLIPLVESEGAELLGKIKALRRQLAQDLGFIVPSIHIKDNLQLRPNEYSFLIRGVEVGKGEIMTGHYLAVTSAEARKIDGIPAREPAFGLPALWIREADREKARASGYTVVDPATVIATHLTELVKAHAWELLTRSEVQGLLNNLTKNNPKIVDELIPTHMSLGGVQRVLQSLLKERVPINDLLSIVETLLDYAPATKDTELLTEYVRQALGRFISRQYMSETGDIKVMALDPRFEKAIAQSVDSGGIVTPDLVNRLVRAIESAIKENKFRSGQPVILCSTQVRRFLRRMIEKFIPSIAVLSNAEISQPVKIYTTGVLRYED